LAQLRSRSDLPASIDATKQDPVRRRRECVLSSKEPDDLKKQIARWKAGAVHGTRKMTVVDRKLDRTVSNV